MGGEICIPIEDKASLRCEHLAADEPALHSALLIVNGEQLTIRLCRDCASKGVSGHRDDTILLAP